MSTTTDNNQTTFEVTSDTELVTTRVINAPQELVFDAHTQPEHLRKWMLGPDGWTMNVCEIDLREGGSYKWGWSSDDGSQESFGFHGVVQDVERPSRLSFTEMWGLDGDGPATLNSYQFVAEGDRTRVIATTTFVSKEMRDQILATGMNEGVSASYDRLERVLAEK